MVELDQLTELLNADYVMSSRFAVELSKIACDLEAKCPNCFGALSVVGSTVNGGAVAKSILSDSGTTESVTDIDYGIIFNRQISVGDRYFLHCYINDKFREAGLNSCETFNVVHFY